MPTIPAVGEFHRLEAIADGQLDTAVRDYPADSSPADPSPGMP
ncbi:hypothetical protein [Methylobacterium sp. ID0610]